MKTHVSLSSRMLALCGVLVLGAVMYLHDTAREEIVLLFDRSAERAYAIGNSHFDSSVASDYDLDRAEELLERALSRSGDLPYANHQLARISFLRGDFDVALERIQKEFAQPDGPASPSTFYIRALIKGFDGDYVGSASDYRTYLQHDPSNWAATNDLAWVLLKDGRFQETLDAVEPMLRVWPENPWLHNSRAIALYELGHYEEALESAIYAHRYVDVITEEGWSKAFPGNDPLIARQGIETFQKAVRENMHRIGLAYQKVPK